MWRSFNVLELREVKVAAAPMQFYGAPHEDEKQMILRPVVISGNESSDYIVLQVQAPDDLHRNVTQRISSISTITRDLNDTGLLRFIFRNDEVWNLFIPQKEAALELLLWTKGALNCAWSRDDMMHDLNRPRVMYPTPAPRAANPPTRQLPGRRQSSTITILQDSPLLSPTTSSRKKERLSVYERGGEKKRENKQQYLEREDRDLPEYLRRHSTSNNGVASDRPSRGSPEDGSGSTDSRRRTGRSASSRRKSTIEPKTRPGMKELPAHLRTVEKDDDPHLSANDQRRKNSAHSPGSGADLRDYSRVARLFAGYKHETIGVEELRAEIVAQGSEVPATLRTKGEFLQLLENVLTEKANPGERPRPIWMRTSTKSLDATGQKKNLWHTTIAPRLNLMSSFRTTSSKKKKKAPNHQSSPNRRRNLDELMSM